MLQVLEIIFFSDIERHCMDWWKYIISVTLGFASDVSLSYQIIPFAIVDFFLRILQFSPHS